MVWKFEIGNIQFQIFFDEFWLIRIFYKGKLFIDDIFLDDFLEAIKILEENRRERIEIEDRFVIKRYKAMYEFEVLDENFDRYMVIVVERKLFLRKLRETLTEIVRNELGFILSFLFS